MSKRVFGLELYTPRLRSFISQQVAQLIDRWRAPIAAATSLPLPEHLMGEVQRFGGSAWQKIATRWPALAELLRERRPRARHVSKPVKQPVPERVVAPETTDALIVQLMAASSWQARAGAALGLAHHSDEGVVEALLHGLRDSSVEVAVAAVDALANHVDERATQGLLGVLQNQDGYFSPVTRVAAISALAQRLDGDQFEPICAALRDIDAEVCIAAAAVLTERVPQLARTRLLPVLQDPSGFYLPIVRLAIANALERSGLLFAGVACELLPSERDPAVRRVFERASHLTGEISLGK